MTGTRGGLVKGAQSPAAQLPMSLQPHTQPDAQGQALALYSMTTVSSMARTGFVIWEQGYRRKETDGQALGGGGVRKGEGESLGHTT